MSTSLAPLIRVLRQHRAASIGAFSTSIGVTVVEVLLPLLTRDAVDVATGQAGAGESSTATTLFPSLSPLWAIVACLVIATVARYALQFSRRFSAGILSINVQHRLRVSMLDTVLKLGGPAQDSLHTGQAVSRSISDISTVQGLCAVLPLTVGNATKLVLTAGVIVWLSPVLSLLAFATLPLVYLLGYRSRTPLFEATRAAQDQAATVTGVVEETVTGIRVVKAFSQQQREDAHLHAESKELYRRRLQVARVTALFQPVMEQLPLAALVANIMAGGWLALQGTISIGTFVAFATYVTTLSQVTKMLSGMVIRVQTGISSLARITEILDLAPPHAPTASTSLPDTSTALGIDAQKVTVAGVLDSISFTAQPGKTLCIVGPPGSGKSMMVQLLSGFYQPDSGSLALIDAAGNRTDYADLDPDTVRSQLTSVLDDTFLYSSTIMDNLTMGREFSEEEILTATTTAQAHEFISALPHGYQETIGERGLTLSGGQRQRLALARALLAGRKILVLDDATSAIDAITEAAIYDALRDNYPEVTVIAIAHRPSTMRVADHIVEFPNAPFKSEDERDTHALWPEISPQPHPPSDQFTAVTEQQDPFSLRRLLGHAKTHIMLVVALLMVGVLADLAFPSLVRLAVDQGVLTHNVGTLQLATAVGTVIVVVSGAAAAARTLLTARVGERLLLILRVRSFAHLQRLSMSYFESTTAGRIITRMTTDIDALSSFLQTGVAQVIVACGTLVGITIMLVVTDFSLALTALAAVPVIIVATLIFRRISRRLYQRAREEISTVNSQFHEAFSGLRTTQLYRAEPFMLRQFQDMAEQYRRTRIKAQTGVAIYFPGISAVSELTHAAVLGVGAHQVMRGELSPGVLIAFLMYLGLLFGPLQDLSQLFDAYQQAAIGLRRIADLLATQPTVPDTGTRTGAPGAAEGPLALVDTSFTYRTDQSTENADILSQLNLRIEPGSTVAIVGATGAGKSTLIKLIARFYDPLSGLVTASGTDIREFPLAQWRGTLGYVPQEAHLFTGTVAYNIGYGRPSARAEEIVEAARAVGALPVIEGLAHGFNQEVGERGRALSSGQRQLVALARAELVDPHVLLLDEATATLDPETEAAVVEASTSMRRGRTSILIAHRLSTAAQADRILVMHHGNIVEDGTHDQLIAAGGRYAALWSAH